MLKPLPALLAFCVMLFCGAAQACERIAPDSAFASAMLEPGERRVAFVAGVGAYQALTPLPNPPRDANALSQRLSRLGFEVFAAVNPNEADFAACFEAFETAAARASLALFYYSGHGVQFGDANYITVTDSRLNAGSLQAFVALNDLMSRLARTSAARLIFLDACRDNPLSNASAQGARAIRAGLGATPQTQAGPSGAGQFVAYSTSPNATASDGTGTLSPFSQAIVEHVGDPGVSVQRMMSEVTRSVGEQTNYIQTPWTRSSLTRDVFLNGRLDLAALQGASEAFAAESERLIDVANDRPGAIAEALKGIALSAPDAPAFAAARGAYQKAVRSARVRLPVHASGAQAHAIFSFDTRRVLLDVAENGGQSISLWNAETGARLAAVTTPSAMRTGFGLAFSPDNARAIALNEASGEFTLLDAANGRVLQRFSVPAMFDAEGQFGKYGVINQLVLSNGGARLLVNASPRSFVWDIAGARVLLEVRGNPGRLQADLKVDGSEAVFAAPALVQSAQRVFAPRGEGGGAQNLHRFNLSSGALAWSSQALAMPQPKYSPSGRLLAGQTGGPTPELYVWNASTGAPVAHASGVQAIIDPSERRTLGNTRDRAVFAFPGLEPAELPADMAAPVLHRVINADGVEIPSFLSPPVIVWQRAAAVGRAALEQQRASLPASLATAVQSERLRYFPSTSNPPR